MITTQDLIDQVRSRADIQRTKHITDDEIVVWLNDEGSEIYYKVIMQREDYVTRSASINLGISGFNELASVNIVDGFSLLVDGTSDVSLPIFGLSASPDYYKIVSLKIEPIEPCNTGNTFFNLKKNGGDIGTVIEVASGASTIAFDDSVDTYFISTDTISLSITVASPSAGWNSKVTVVAVPFSSVTIANAASLPHDFLKPICLSLPLGNKRNREVLPLESVHDRYVCSEPRYWIQDQRIEIYPEINVNTGPYSFVYVPEWVALKLTPTPNSLIREMERFSEVIGLGAAAMCKLKRRMPEDAAALQSKQDAMTNAAINMIPGRKGGPKKIPMPLRDRERFRGGQFTYGNIWPFIR